MRPNGIKGSVQIAAMLVMVGASAAIGSEGEAKPTLFSGDLGNIFWSLITFFTVLFVLGKFAWKPILGALQGREEFIRSSLEHAKTDREAAESRLKEYEARLARHFSENCIKCHGGIKGLPSLTTYEAVKKHATIDKGASIDSLTRVSHIHLFGIAFIYFFIGLIFQIIHRAHARDAAGNIKHIRAQLAGHQIGFIAAGERQHQIGIGRTGALQHHGRRGIAVQRLHIELAAQIVQRRFVDIDNGHIVIGHAGQILRHGRADLAAAENEDFHV